MRSGAHLSWWSSAECAPACQCLSHTEKYEKLRKYMSAEIMD